MGALRLNSSAFPADLQGFSKMREKFQMYAKYGNYASVSLPEFQAFFITEFVSRSLNSWQAKVNLNSKAKAA